MVRQVVTLITLLMVMAVVACDGHTDNVQEVKSMDIDQDDIRHAAYAGSWYEGNPEKLKQIVSLYMENAKITSEQGKRHH